MPSLLDLLGETWPARMAKSAWSAAKLPGDVYAGRTDPLSDEGIGRAADLGGMVMGGTYAGAPRGAMGAGAVKPIRAYHGSPHDFDRFDLSKIGTGEGAQAYGHGLYFAENPAVAKEYRETLAGRGLTPAQGIADAVINTAGYGREKGIGYLQAQMEKNKGIPKFPVSTDEYKEAIKLLEAGWEAPKGRMYEVNINADPAHFLDWDKMVAQQQAGVKVPGIYGPTQTGEGFYRALEIAKHQPNRGHLDRQAASDFLREAGIPGIKYLDQGSRGNWTVRENPKGFYGIQSTSPGVGGAVSENFPTRELAQDWVKKQQSSNYVLFRDDIIDIVKKYGLAGAAAMYGISQDEAKAAMDNPKDKKMSIGRQTYGDEE